MLASFCPQDLVERERETERARESRVGFHTSRLNLQAITQIFPDVHRQGERYVAKENVLQFERLGSDLQVTCCQHPESCFLDSCIQVGCSFFVYTQRIEGDRIVLGALHARSLRKRVSQLTAVAA